MILTSSRPSIPSSQSSTSGLKAIVIGSGFGGLAAAIRLQASGAQVTLLEQRPLPGGRAYPLCDQGYTFDMGPSLITAPKVIDSVFQAAGKRLDHALNLIPLNPFYRVYFHEGSRFDYNGNPDHMKAQMRQFNAHDATQYDTFMRDIRPIYEAVIEQGVGASPFDKPSDMLSLMPTLLKTGAWRTATGFVNRYFKDWRHRFLFSFHSLYIGGHPFHCPAIYLLIPYLERAQGVFYTRGGMHSLVKAMVQVFEEAGGSLRTSTPAKSVTTENGRVTGVQTQGQFLPADIVVSNADVATTYRHLLPGLTRRTWTNSKLDRQHYTMSCFLLFLGLRRQYPQLAHHTLILAERYRDLLYDIFGRKVLPDDFSLYAHAPTRTDNSMAPEGCESLMILVPVANQASGIDWNTQREAFANKVIEFLERWGLENLHANIEIKHTFTPIEFQSELGAHLGNAFGLEPRLSQTGYFRPHNRSEEVEGLYFVGAGTHPGAGVPGVMLSAEAAMNCILADLPQLRANQGLR